MIPTAFDEANTVYDPPKGMTQEEVHSINAFQGTDPRGIPVLITCWKITKEELEELQKTGRVWLWIFGNQLPVHSITTQHPFQ